jgi:hypothetical protein
MIVNLLLKGLRMIGRNECNKHFPILLFIKIHYEFSEQRQ